MKLALTPELIAKIVEPVAEYGVTASGAAAAAGVNRNTLNGWLQVGKKARDEDRKCIQRDLVEAWEEAEGHLEYRWLKDASVLQKKGNIGWRMNMELLQQRFDGWKKKLPSENIQPNIIIINGRPPRELAMRISEQDALTPAPRELNP